MEQNEYQEQPKKNSNRTLWWILGGCSCLLAILVIAGVIIPTMWANLGSNYHSQKIIALKALLQLKNAASIYEANQKKPVKTFTEFVTNDSAKISDPSSGMVFDISNLGNAKATPCDIQPEKIVCSGRISETHAYNLIAEMRYLDLLQERRFPNMLGDITYFFNQGPATFSIHCDSGRKPPPDGWNAEECRFNR